MDEGPTTAELTLRYILNFYDVLKIVKIVCANTFYILYIFIFYIYFIHTYICYFIYVYIVTVFSLISGICSSVTELIPNRIRFFYKQNINGTEIKKKYSAHPSNIGTLKPQKHSKSAIR